MNGGYKVIDFKNTNLSTTSENGVAINGIYEAIENSYRKPLIASGIVIEGVEKNSVTVEITSGENSYSFTVYGKTITITNSDIVTIA